MMYAFQYLFNRLIYRKNLSVNTARKRPEYGFTLTRIFLCKDRIYIFCAVKRDDLSVNVDKNAFTYTISVADGSFAKYTFNFFT